MNTKNSCLNLENEPHFSKKIHSQIVLEEFDDMTINSLSNSARQLKLLLVEDDPDSRYILEHILENFGIHVTAVSNGDECLEFSGFAASVGEEFDVVLMDLQLPDIDGFTAAKTLRWQGYNGTIIAMTGKPLTIDKEEYRQAGCDYYLKKWEIQEKLPGYICSNVAS